MWLSDSNHGTLIQILRRIWGKVAQNPEAAKASDEEYQEVHCPPDVGSISARSVKYTKVLCKAGQQMVV